VRKFLTLLLCASLILGVPGTREAFADVRKADIVLGTSVDSRGLSLAQCPSIEAQYAIVMDSEGKVYFDRNAYAPIQIASITKIMTALVALENSTSETVVVVSERAASIGESSASLQEGDVLSFDAALKGLMLSSGNDAAVAIAECVGERLSGGTAKGLAAEKVFVERMNAKAAEMGLTDTVFRNPHGLDDGEYEGDQHSCASDVALMARAAMQYESFRTVVGTAVASITVTHADNSQEAFELISTDWLLGQYEGACGIKTGFTDAAGYCFAGAVNRGGDYLYAVALKSTDEESRFADTATLFDWYYAHQVDYALAHSDHTTTREYQGQVENVPLVAEVAHTGWIDKRVKATLADPAQEIAIFDLNGNINQTIQYKELTGDIRTGDVVGSITFKQRNDLLLTVDIVACEDLRAPDFFQGIGIWWDRFFRGFSGQPQVAESVLINQTPLVDDRTRGN
jgi:D-alanyl-D-alanine carboxypeptidase (penicillin-binding protein 5/6)